jgi:hypothetical protein
MYYEEKWFAHILKYRSTPDGEWLPLTEVMVGNKLREADAALAARDARIAELEKALLACKREHDVVDGDCWYSCPKSGQCCDDSKNNDLCECGADALNARIDAVLARKL